MARRLPGHKERLEVVRELERQNRELETVRGAKETDEHAKFPKKVTRRILQALMERLILTDGQVDVVKFLAEVKPIYAGFPKDYERLRSAVLTAYAVTSALVNIRDERECGDV